MTDHEPLIKGTAAVTITSGTPFAVYQAGMIKDLPGPVD